MKSFVKRNLSVIIATLCLILCILAVLPFAIHIIEGREISYDYSAEVSSRGLYFYNYEQVGSRVRAKDEKSCVILPVSDDVINDVRIVFKGGVSDDITIKLRYAKKGEALDESNMIVKDVEKTSPEYYANLDRGVYQILECYIPGTFEIEKVILSHVTEEKIVRDIGFDTQLFLWVTLPALGAYVIALSTSVILKKKRK